MHIFDNYSHEYKNRKDFWTLDKILLGEFEFVSEFKEQLDHSPTHVFHEHHDYELFLLNQEIHTSSDNLSHQDSHDC